MIKYLTCLLTPPAYVRIMISPRECFVSPLNPTRGTVFLTEGKDLSRQSLSSRFIELKPLFGVVNLVHLLSPYTIVAHNNAASVFGNGWLVMCPGLSANVLKLPFGVNTSHALNLKQKNWRPVSVKDETDVFDRHQKEKRVWDCLTRVSEMVGVKMSHFEDSTLDGILKLLFQHAGNVEEETRQCISEALGSMAIMEPKKLLNLLKLLVESKSAYKRATAVLAIKYALVDDKLDNILPRYLRMFLSLIKDENEVVRRAALLTLRTTAHKKPNLIQHTVRPLMPSMIKTGLIQMKYNERLIVQAMRPALNHDSVGYLFKDCQPTRDRKSVKELMGLHRLLGTSSDDENPS